MVLKRGDNVNHHNVLYLRTTADEEFEAFEALGPAMQGVLRDGPIKSSAVAILKNVTDKNVEIEQANEVRMQLGYPPSRLLDPKDPSLDLHLARSFLMLNAQTIMKDRDAEFAQMGIVPLKGRYNPKTERDQRRLRRVRWR